MKKKFVAVSVFILGALSVINVFVQEKKDALNYVDDKKEFCGERVCKRDKTERKIEGESVKLNTKKNEKDLLSEDEKKERRNTRVTPIIGIIATIIALATCLFELSRGLLDIWEIQGIVFECGFIIYWYILASVILIGLDILFFISADLHRYNVQEGKCKEYDDKADRAFYNLIGDYNVCKWVLIAGNILIIILGVIYMEGAEKWIMLFIIAGSVIILVYGVLESFKKENGKVERVKAAALRVCKLILVFFISLLISVSFYSDDNLNFSVRYDLDGTVDINLSSEFTKNCGMLSVRINDENDKSVYNEIIEKEEMLISYEEKNDMLKVNNRTVEEEKITRGVKNHWRYHLNLHEINLKLKPARYECIVTLLYDDQTVTFRNEFLYNNDFIFAEESKKASINVL